ncbi:MAG: hypothetical protein ACHQD9_05685, partial [Chitinophagales bacterium]
TIASKFSADSLNVKLRTEPKGFPIPDEENLSDVTQVGDGSFAPSYYNNNIFKKQLAFDSYNPFDLKSKDSLDHFSKKTFLLQHPLFYFSNHAVAYSRKPSDTAVLVQSGDVLLDSDVTESLAIAGQDSLKGVIQIQKFIPGKIFATATTNESSILTLLQNFYLGWTAEIDGKPANIFISNFSMMSIVVPAGDHQISFQYTQRFILALLDFSITAQLLCVAILIAGKRKKKFIFI